MADSTITGNFPDVGDSFQFNVNGLATQKQMEKLIQLTQAMAKRIKADIDTGAKVNKEQKEHLDNLEELSGQQKKQIKQNRETKEAWEDLIGTTDKLRYGWKSAIKDLGGWQSAVTGVTGFLVGSLTSYADSLSGALKMGVSGNIMDFAIASKTAGVSMTTFTKALSETGGGFASLGNGATDGAKNFAALASGVRAATAGVGNLGMTLDENAMFTAQQTKLAVSQGFKGKAAQDVVIRNSQYLGKELDDLANRTGKNVLEMAAAAAKLASDPIVTTFVKSAQAGGAAVSKAVQSFGASLNAQFGEVGGQLGSDVLKSALGGLPFAITQTGKNMLIASQSTYNELERQAQKAKRGEEITAEDRKKLNDTVLQEVAARGDQLRMMANLEGPAGDSARQLLSMAKEAEFYNSAEGAKRRAQDKSAQEFNTAIRQFQANIQALAIPFLNLINGIDWTLFIDVIGGAIKVLGILLTPLSLLGKIIGDTGVGTVIGGLGALALVFLQGKAAFEFLVDTVKKVAGSLKTITSGFGTAVKSVVTPVNKNQDIIDRATQARKPVVDRANDLYQGYGGRIDRAEALRQANRDHMASMGTGMEGQRKREEYIRLQAESARAREEMKKPATPATPAPVESKWSKASTLVEKFAGAITGATAALAGSALAIWGESRLREDENDWLGQILVTGGKTLEVLGLYGGLVMQFGGSILTFVSTTFPVFTAAVTTWASTALASITTFAATAGTTMLTWASTALMSVTSFALKMAASTMSLLIPLKGLAIAAFAAAAPFLPLIAAVTAIAGVGYLIYDNWESIVNAGKALYDWIASAATKLWDFITSPFKMLSDWLKGSWLGKMFGGGDNKESAKSNTQGESARSIQTRESIDRLKSKSEGLAMMTAGRETNPDGTASESFKRFRDADGKLMQSFSAAPIEINKSGYSKELSNTQSNAIDQNRLKDSENTSLQKKQISLLEEMNGTNNAQLGVQAKSASAQDNGNRYLKTLSMNGTG
jgi:hypothetical protein